MKKVLIPITMFAMCIALASCSDGTMSQTEKLFKQNPATIKWQGSTEEAESCSTKVKVYTSNNRSTEGMVQSNEYKMTLKKIDDVQYVRMDFDEDFNGGVKRSVVSNDKEIVIFNTADNQVELRTALDEQPETQLDFLTANPITGKMCVSDVKENALKLNFDTTTDGNGICILTIPQQLLSSAYGSSVISAKITMDEASETLVETEVVTVDEDGSITTTTQIPVMKNQMMVM